MAIRLTKDLLAAFITSVFLLWILASAFAPLILHVQVYNDKGQTLVALDLLAAAFCLVGYILTSQRIPEETRANTR